jgi:hypothetical protein
VFIIFIAGQAMGRAPERFTGQQITFAIGCWLCFCAKHPPRTWTELVSSRYLTKVGWSLTSLGAALGLWAVCTRMLLGWPLR